LAGGGGGGSGKQAPPFIVRIRLQFFANDAELEANYAAIIRPVLWRHSRTATGA